MFLYTAVLLNPSGLNDTIIINDIESTTVTLKDGSTYLIQGGYLDIGIIDTMKDLFVNLIGAVVFSVIGYFYILGRNKGVFAKKFIPLIVLCVCVVIQGLRQLFGRNSVELEENASET